MSSRHVAIIKTAEEIEIMAEGGELLAVIMADVKHRVAPGVRLSELDSHAKELMYKTGGKPSFLGYRSAGARKPFPASICTSVNDVVVHGIPNAYKLHEGDVVKLDFGLLYKGFHTDAGFTVGVGVITKDVERLIAVTQRALEAAIKYMRIGNTLGDVGHIIHKTVTAEQFFVVRNLTGHGVGRALHEHPNVYNWGERGKGIHLKEGMVFAIEPMTAIGTESVIELPDESFATADGSISAFFEHTIAVIKDGPRILTQQR